MWSVCKGWGVWVGSWRRLFLCLPYYLISGVSTGNPYQADDNALGKTRYEGIRQSVHQGSKGKSRTEPHSPPVKCESAVQNSRDDRARRKDFFPHTRAKIWKASSRTARSLIR